MLVRPKNIAEKGPSYVPHSTNKQICQFFHRIKLSQDPDVTEGSGFLGLIHQDKLGSFTKNHSSLRCLGFKLLLQNSKFENKTEALFSLYFL